MSMHAMKTRTRYSTQFTGQWEWVPTVNADDGPSARCGHTLTVHGTQLDHSQFITQYAAQKNNTNNCDTPAPKPLGDTHGKLLVSFGESSLLASREYLNDMYLLDLATLQWVKVLGKNVAKEYKPYMKVNFNPVARADHAATAFGNNLDQCLMFGGKCQDTYLSDLILVKNICNFPINRVEQEIYETHHSLGTRLNGHDNHENSGSGSSSSGSSSRSSSKQLYTDTPLRIEAIHLRNGPSARRGASLTPWQGKGSFLLFGGQCGSLFFNDLWGLDLYKQGWVELATQRNPMERAFHSTFVDSQQQMLLLGGVRDTQANPVPPDIFKLDLRVGKFFKLGDKDMVPGVAAALSKGHHSSHFLSKKCDLAIFAPQNSAAYLLGGNVQSEHCGRCAEMFTFTGDADSGKPKPCRPPVQSPSQQQPQPPPPPTRDVNQPPGACRPATALLESHHSPKEWRSLGCNQRALERLFVFGGYSPSTRSCTRQLYSLKFSVETCKSVGHECRFSDTPVIADTLLRCAVENGPGPEAEAANETPHHVDRDDDDVVVDAFAADEDMKTISASPNLSPKLTPQRVNVNVTPMRATRRMQHRQAACDDADSDSGGCQQMNSSMLCTSMKQPTTPARRAAALPTPSKKKRKHVSLVPTPVRATSRPAANLTLLRMHDESSIANQKIVAIDRELTAAYQHRDGQTADEEEHASRAPFHRDEESKKPLHRQYIEHILFHFEESFLDPDASFILDPSQVLEIIHTALPLLEEDPILIRTEAPVKIFGDIHGQLGDLMNLFASFGCPDDQIGDLGYYKYLFLGDFVDRGHKSLEVMCLLLALKIEYPRRVFLIRGNHECHAMNEMYGFYAEITERLYPHPSTLKYLDHDVLNENVPAHLDRELSEYFARVERNRQTVSLLDRESDTMLDIDLPFEMVDVEVDDEDAHNQHQRTPTQQQHEQEHDPALEPLPQQKKTKKRKKYKTRRFFRDRADCITYLVQSFELTFRWLPLASLVGGKILCVHGGIGQIESIEEIEQLQRPCDVVCDVSRDMDEQQRRIVDLLWSDPAETDTDTGFQPNKRGVSCVFGSDVVRGFCKRNNIDLIVRGHQVVKDGFEYFAGGHLITLFSATNYCNVMDNAGAILCIDGDLRVIAKLVEPRKMNFAPLHERGGGGGDECQDDADHDEECEKEKEELMHHDAEATTTTTVIKHIADDRHHDDDDDGPDNLQWRKLKQFPPSPMRNSGGQLQTNMSMMSPQHVQHQQPQHSETSAPNFFTSSSFK